MHKRLLILLLTMATAAYALTSCIDKEALNSRLDAIEEKISILEKAVIAANENAIAISALLKESTLIVGVTEIEGGYTLELSDGTKARITAKSVA